MVTLLANLTTAAKQQQLDPTVDLPAEDKAASPDTMYAHNEVLTFVHFLLLSIFIDYFIIFL